MKPFARLKETVATVKSGLHEEHNHHEGTPINPDSLTSAFKRISHECNKLALSYRSKPVPTEVEADAMVKGLEAALIDGLLKAFIINTSEKKAATYNKTVKVLCLDVLEAVEWFSDILPSSSDELLKRVGNVWQKCEEVNLPKGHVKAVAEALNKEKYLINDAINELNDSLEEESDEWSDEAKDQLMPPSLGLLKVALNLMKKVISTMNKGQEEVIEESERISTHLKQLSCFVDDFALTLYPPLDTAEITDKSVQLIDFLNRFLEEVMLEKETSLLFGNKEDEEVDKWRKFLLKALKHNSDKLSIYLTKLDMNQMTL